MAPKRFKKGSGKKPQSVSSYADLLDIDDDQLLSSLIQELHYFGNCSELHSPSSYNSFLRAIVGNDTLLDKQLIEKDEKRDSILRSLAKCVKLESPHVLHLSSEYWSLLLESRNVERVLQSSFPRRSYERRKGRLKSVVHWGQRKLLMSEIEFLTRFGNDVELVVYAGAAPATHTLFLASLFPEKKFVLVDPGEFHIKSTDRVTVRKEFFTDEVAESFAQWKSEGSGRDLLLISDIRTANFMSQDAAGVEDSVFKDMQDQRKWVEIMKPLYSMLKFRLPYGEGTTEYLDGEIFLPVWGPQTTTECRLITDGRRTKMYSNVAFEEQLFYFNTVHRVLPHETPMIGEGLDRCYDCAAEMHILLEYIRKREAMDLVEQKTRCENMETLAEKGEDDAARQNCEATVISDERESTACAKGEVHQPVHSTGLPKRKRSLTGDEEFRQLQEMFAAVTRNCSKKGRSLLDVLPPVENRKWFKPKVIDKENKIYRDI